MNKERELLRAVLNSVPFSHSHEKLKAEIEAELAKPDTEFKTPPGYRLQPLSEYEAMREVLAANDEIEGELAKPEPEPVAWLEKSKNFKDSWFLVYHRSPNAEAKPLYTSPHPMQRLTDDDLSCLAAEFYRDPCVGDIQWARFIEENLIEKNK
jgi:hypothetical protein